MRKTFNDESLRQLADSVDGRLAGLASAMAAALAEVHGNMEALGSALGGCTYDGDREMLSFLAVAAASGQEGQGKEGETQGDGL